LISKLAEGDILCNVDADNYTGQEYATYINKEFNSTLPDSKFGK
jgi:hypothetical protein